MKNKLFLLDLALCSLWALAILGGRHNWSAAPLLASLAAVYFRITFAFTFNRNDKRSWIPLVGMWSSFGLMFCVNGFPGFGDMLQFSANLLEYNLSKSERYSFGTILILLIWLLPIALYLVQLFRKRLIKTELTYKDMFGVILWTDRKAANYSKLMLVSIGALYAGLAMDARTCRFACIVAPALSYYIVCQYYMMKAEKLWVILIGMIMFFYAQVTCDYIRVSLLAVSFALVVYMGCLLHNKTKQFYTTFLVIIYIGIILPSLSIGYNQYACINYARTGFYSLGTIRGVFIIKNGDGVQMQLGLRDRYGLLVRPEYDDLKFFKEQNSWFAKVELRKCGDIRIYDIANNKFGKKSDIDSILQEKVYNCIEKYYEGHEPNCGEKCQVVVTNLSNGKTIANLKINLYGNMHINYDDKPFFTNDTIQLNEGKCIYGEMREEYSYRRTASYMNEIRDSISQQSYMVKVNLAADKTPEEDNIVELTNEICGFLVKVDE